MSDDGSERDLAESSEDEIFSSRQHMSVESESDDGAFADRPLLQFDLERDAHQMAVRARRRARRSVRDRPGIQDRIDLASKGGPNSATRR